MLRLTQKYSEKRAFITGAAMGLGKSFCIHLAKEGWTIGMSDVNIEQLEAAAAEVRQLGGEPIIFSLDVSDRKRYEEVANMFLEQQGGIDLLVNNAGVGDGGAFHEYPLKDWDWMIGINQMGVLYGCKLFVPAFRKQGFGTIINIASAAGFANAPRMAPYNMTKAAVISLSETLYYELKPLGISVSVVMPTFIRTGIMDSARGTKDALAAGKKLVSEAKLMPDDAVLEMLQKAGKEKLHIILPRQARFTFLLKRFLPGLFRSQLMKISEKHIARDKRLAK